MATTTHDSTAHSSSEPLKLGTSSRDLYLGCSPHPCTSADLGRQETAIRVPPVGKELPQQSRVEMCLLCKKEHRPFFRSFANAYGLVCIECLASDDLDD